MPTRPWNTRLVVAAALSGALAVAGSACRGDERDRQAALPVGDGGKLAAFVERANAICARAHARYSARPGFPFDDFDPEQPDPRRLPAVGRYFAGAQPILRETTAQLTELGPPPTKGREWNALISALRAELRNSSVQSEAASVRDAKTFVRTVREAGSIKSETERAARSVGADACIFA